MLAWEPDEGTHFGVIPRNGSAEDVRWFSTDARFMFHMMNAWTDGTKLHADVTGANATQFAPKIDGAMATEADGIAPTFRRWSVDLAANTDTITEELFDDMPCEFPRTDDRLGTKPYRHGYAAGTLDKTFSNFDTLVSYLVALVYDAPSNTSELAILDSQNIDHGPVATAKVAHTHTSRLPRQLVARSLIQVAKGSPEEGAP